MVASSKKLVAIMTHTQKNAMKNKPTKFTRATKKTLEWIIYNMKGYLNSNSPGFPVAEHFNSASHSLNDMMICGLTRCSGDNTRRKNKEMRLFRARDTQAKWPQH